MKNRKKSATTAETKTKRTGAQKGRSWTVPQVGTVIEKRDRKGELRCSVKVVEDGFRCNGITFHSLTAAALQACRDLGLKGAPNGATFWGLDKAKTSKK